MAQGKSIVVIGSSNTDMVIKTERFPQPGETILGGNFFMFPGGKGANQAVAAARLGGNVTFIAKLGRDVFGDQALRQFKEENIDTKFIIQDPAQPSGTALITVDAKGENTIVVAQGANGALVPTDLKPAVDVLKHAYIALVQLEIPMSTVSALTEQAKSYGVKVILNPAPAATIPDAMYRQLYLITPNRSEAQQLTGIPVTDVISARYAAENLHGKGVENVVITLGSEGAFVWDGKDGQHIESPKVKALDTTAAGDIFNGALVVALAEGQSLPAAVAFSNRCAAISVTRMGAQSSAPYRKEVVSETIVQ
jgi:ribokinase